MSSSVAERALPPGPGPRALPVRTPQGTVLPSAEDPVPGGLVAAIGGPPGAHARLGERRFWTPVRWMVLLTLAVSLLGFWQKAPCRYEPWADQYQYTRLCYTDVYALYYSEQLNVGKTPYLEFPVEYPVLTGVVMHAAAQVANAFPAPDRAARFYDLTWLLLTASAVVVTVTTVRLAGRRRVWDAALFAAAPGLVLHGSTNWDLVATALAGLALVAWAKKQPVLAGALLGLGTATKLYPVLFLVPMLALAVRTRTLRTWLAAAVATGVTGLAVVIPVFLSSPYFAEVDGQQTQVASSPLERLATEGPSALLQRHVTVPDLTDPGAELEGTNAVFRFVELNSDRPADWDSLHFALGKLRVPEQDRPFPADLLAAARNGAAALVPDFGKTVDGVPVTLNTTVAVSLLVGLALVCALALLAPRRPRLAQLLFLTLVVFVLTNKVFSPQYTIWLIPLAVLARPRWRPFLVWQVLEALVLFTRFYFFIGNAEPGQGLDVGWFLTAILLRDLALVVLAALVVRDVLRPRRDVVRTDPLTGQDTGVDDPMGGVFNQARRPSPVAPPPQVPVPG